MFPYVQNKSEVHLDIIYTIDNRCESRHHFQDKILTGLGLIFYESVKFNIYWRLKIFLNNLKYLNCFHYILHEQKCCWYLKESYQ